MKVLILCTGNSCRSQMAQAFLQLQDAGWQVCSAGTSPVAQVNPYAVEVMKEVGLDISANHPRDVRDFLNESWDYVITVCGGAHESCPTFSGTVRHRQHIGFLDPAEVRGADEEIRAVFRKVRDEIDERFRAFYCHVIENHKQKNEAHN